ncbi:hypothetical protein [Pontimicrobium sp. IMCC45349]|jgi:hypothetical protein|uniref:hypothetical protein n=1 Tax=Pontimicrobium sp. IMCC45349 TaxID=3391574 RepID=UPI0039A277CC
MKKLFITAVFSLFTFIVVAQEWQKFKSETFEFTADYPGEPKYSTQEIPTGVGNLTMHMFMLSELPPESKNAVYSVIRSDYPEDMFEEPEEGYIKTVLDGAVNGAVTNVNGRLLIDNSITFNGYPGRSIKIAIEGAYIYIRCYLVKNIMYISQVVTLDVHEDNADIDKFHDSFELIKVKHD